MTHEAEHDQNEQSAAHALIRALTTEAQSASRADECLGTTLVLLQEEVDGVRCILVRSDQDKSVAPLLSPRETQIARLIAHGHQNKAIAEILSISVWTVNTHVRRIFVKIGVSSRAAMARHLVELDLLR